ncbi:tannase and feruloyl esterase [Penicillium malachiteum]|uniref:tannase and feruloyl esterase n=1 Tax=Penicillium malachiteum TaxID=1324776 RepID=UPI0025473D44|nr:tannase and feruloyl esterase [Penicillium malachiteum]KAJ5730551.1 tannase and feruloyl esterase [Penicillium malachiteum]
MMLSLGLLAWTSIFSLASAQSQCSLPAGDVCAFENATTYEATGAPNCTTSGVQKFVNKLAGNETRLTVAYAFYINNNATLNEFTDYVNASTFTPTNSGTPVCAFRVDGKNKEGASWGLGALLPAHFNRSLMMAAPDVGISWGVASAGLRYAFATFASNSGQHEPDHVSGWETQNGLTAWSHRALQLSTITAKAIVKAWYGVETKYSYINGCSGGRRQVLKSIQTYPDDYDGAMAGAPTWWLTHQEFYNNRQTTLGGSSNVNSSIPSSLYPVIEGEVIRQCDPQDGLTDRVVSNPQGCFFNAAALACNSTQTSDCLTPHSAKDPSKDNVLGLKNFTSKDLTYKLIKEAESLNPAQGNADEFDLSPFFEKGGKLFHWHGMSDSIVSPGPSVYYHNQTEHIAQEKGINMTDSYLLYLIPGLEHCTGTSDCVEALWYLAGPYQAGNFFNFTPANVVENYPHDFFLALMSWVEGGHAPSYMVTTNFENNTDPTRLLHNRKICP